MFPLSMFLYLAIIHLKNTITGIVHCFEVVGLDNPVMQISYRFSIQNVTNKKYPSKK